MPGGLELHFLSPCQGSGLSLCLMSQTCSPVPLRKMIVLHGEILPPWYPCSGPASVPALGGHFPCSIPWAGSQTWLSELPPEPVAQHLLCAESQGGKGLASCQKNHLFLQAFKAWCAGGVCSASPVPQQSCRVCVWTDLYLYRRHHGATAEWGTVDKPPHEPWASGCQLYTLQYITYWQAKLPSQGHLFIL